MPSDDQKKVIIDAYINDGGGSTYDEWMDLERRTRTVNDRSKINSGRFGVFDDALSFMVDRVNHLNDDTKVAMEKIQARQKVDPVQVRDVLASYELALQIAEDKNDLLDAMSMLGIVSLLVDFPFITFAMRADELAKIMEKLKPLLEQARRNARESRIQKALDIGVTIVTSILPELKIIGKLGLVEKIVVGGFKLTYDYVLGPGKPDATKFGKTGFSTFAESIYKSKLVDENASKAIEYAAKGVKYFGWTQMLNFSEIKRSDGSLQQISSLLNSTQKAYNLFLKQIDDNLPALRVMTARIEHAQRLLNGSRSYIWEEEVTFREQIQKTGYSSPMSWRVLP